MTDLHAAAKATSHFLTRALERHGLILHREDIRQIINQIKRREAVFLKWSEGPGCRSFYRVRIYDEDYIVLYEIEIDSLVTIYHNSWLKMKDGEWIPNMKYRKGRRRGNDKW